MSTSPRREDRVDGRELAEKFSANLARDRRLTTSGRDIRDYWRPQSMGAAHRAAQLTLPISTSKRLARISRTLGSFALEQREPNKYATGTLSLEEPQSIARWIDRYFAEILGCDWDY
jgi:hypothetical protein